MQKLCEVSRLRFQISLITLSQTQWICLFRLVNLKSLWMNEELNTQTQPEGGAANSSPGLSVYVYCITITGGVNEINNYYISWAHVLSYILQFFIVFYVLDYLLYISSKY